MLRATVANAPYHCIRYLDQLSTRFRSFRDLAITHIGLELDHMLAALLEHLGAAVPPALTR